MVKGTTRQVMVVNSPDGDLFEQAIFLLKADSLEKQGITERQIIEEARRLTGSCTEPAKNRKGKKRIYPFVWSTLGAGFTGLVWFLIHLIT